MNEQLVVLLAEDNSSDVLLAKRAFERTDATIHLQIVDDGEAAIEYLSGAGIYQDRDRFPLPHLIFLDINMPRRTGFEVMEWLRQQATLQSIPIIVVSSSEEPKDIERAIQLGASQYLTKPLISKSLAPVLQATL